MRKVLLLIWIFILPLFLQARIYTRENTPVSYENYNDHNPPDDKPSGGSSGNNNRDDGMPMFLRETYFWCSKYIAVYSTYLGVKWLIHDLYHHFV